MTKQVEKNKVIQSKIAQNVGYILQNARKAVAGLSRKELAQKTGLSAYNIMAYERNLTSVPLADFILIMDACRMKPDTVLHPMFKFSHYLLNADLSVEQIRASQVGDEYSYFQGKQNNVMLQSELNEAVETILK